MAQLAAHGNDLAFVVDGMGQNVVDDECKSANVDVSIEK